MNHMSIQEVDTEEDEQNSAEISKIRKMTSNKVISEEQRVLILCCVRGDREAFMFSVESYLKNNNDLNFTDERGWTCLHYSVDDGNLKIVSSLLKLNCQVDCKNMKKQTPLHLAVINGYFDITKKLVDHGAEISLSDEENNNCFHLCASNGHLEIMKYLLEHSTFFLVKNLYGKTACDLAQSAKIKEILLVHSKSRIKTLTLNNNIDNPFQSKSVSLEEGSSNNNSYFKLNKLSSNNVVNTNSKNEFHNISLSTKHKDSNKVNLNKDLLNKIKTSYSIEKINMSKKLVFNNFNNLKYLNVNTSSVNLNNNINLFSKNNIESNSAFSKKNYNSNPCTSTFKKSAKKETKQTNNNNTSNTTNFMISSNNNTNINSGNYNPNQVNILKGPISITNNYLFVNLNKSPSNNKNYFKKDVYSKFSSSKNQKKLIIKKNSNVIINNNKNINNNDNNDNKDNELILEKNNTDNLNKFNNNTIYSSSLNVNTSPSNNNRTKNNITSTNESNQNYSSNVKYINYAPNKSALNNILNNTLTNQIIPKLYLNDNNTNISSNISNINNIESPKSLYLSKTISKTNIKKIQKVYEEIINLSEPIQYSEKKFNKNRTNKKISKERIELFSLDSSSKSKSIFKKVNTNNIYLDVSFNKKIISSKSSKNVNSFIKNNINKELMIRRNNFSTNYNKSQYISSEDISIAKVNSECVNRNFFDSNYIRSSTTHNREIKNNNNNNNKHHISINIKQFNKLDKDIKSNKINSTDYRKKLYKSDNENIENKRLNNNKINSVNKIYPSKNNLSAGINKYKKKHVLNNKHSNSKIKVKSVKIRNSKITENNDNRNLTNNHKHIHKSEYFNEEPKLRISSPIIKKKVVVNETKNQTYINDQSNYSHNNSISEFLASSSNLISCKSNNDNNDQNRNNKDNDDIDIDNEKIFHNFNHSQKEFFSSQNINKSSKNNETNNINYSNSNLIKTTQSNNNTNNDFQLFTKIYNEVKSGNISNVANNSSTNNKNIQRNRKVAFTHKLHTETSSNNNNKFSLRGVLNLRNNCFLNSKLNKERPFVLVNANTENSFNPKLKINNTSNKDESIKKEKACTINLDANPEDNDYNNLEAYNSHILNISDYDKRLDIFSFKSNYSSPKKKVPK